jgi:hypothetical protein
MKALRHELRRLLALWWSLPLLLLAAALLVFYFYRMTEGGREAADCLLLLFADKKYHALAYAVLALVLLGTDVSARMDRAERMAGRSDAAFFGRKLALLYLGVLLLEAVYTAACFLLRGLPASLLDSISVGAVLTRLLLDLATAAPFFVIQALAPTITAMLLADGFVLIVWLTVYDAHLEEWYMAVRYGSALPLSWALLPVAIVAATLPAVSAGRMLQKKHW